MQILSVAFGPGLEVWTVYISIHEVEKDMNNMNNVFI